MNGRDGWVEGWGEGGRVLQREGGRQTGYNKWRDGEREGITKPNEAG